MKKAIGYIRISDKDQSNFSISGQTGIDHHLLHPQQLSPGDTFIDDGKSAKNFDRPDWKKLEAFVKKNHKRGGLPGHGQVRSLFPKHR
jgi:site-specific DNA recombinase